MILITLKFVGVAIAALFAAEILYRLIEHIVTERRKKARKAQQLGGEWE
jgi:peptidoglycan/LPS O-acetylase OafA/YrhL